MQILNWYLAKTCAEIKEVERGQYIQPYDADPFSYKKLLLPRFYLW